MRRLLTGLFSGWRRGGDRHDPSRNTHSLPAHGVLPRDSIARWTLIRLGLLLLCVGAGFYLGSAFLLGQRFDAFESAQYTQDLERIAAVVEQDRLALYSSVADYAKWDDSYEFMNGRNPGYLENNINAEALINLRVEWIAFFTPNGQSVLALQLAPDQESLQPLAADHVEQLKVLVTSSAADQKNREGTQVFWLDGRAFMVGLSEVTDNDRKRPANGHLLFVRELNDVYLQSIRNLTGVAFALQPVDATSVSGVMLEQQVGQWQARKILDNLALEIVVRGPGRLVNERRVTHWLLAGNALLLVLISLFGIHAILDRYVLRRLKEFSAYADRRRNESDYEVRWPVEGKDELDNLAVSLNELIEEVERHHSNLNYLANHDVLTDLGNRRQLMIRLKDVQELCRRHTDISCCLLLVDLDSFKLVNDGLGHAAGDWVLQQVAQRIRSLIRSGDTLVRLGGDEFALLLNQITPEQAVRFAERMGQSLSQSASYEEQQLTISASIGIAQVRCDLSPDEVLRNADLAMYEAKRLGKKRVVMFDEVLLDVAARHLRLEQALHSVLESDALEVWFQPIVDGRDQRVVGMEALARWSLEGCYIPPDEFIRLAERNGMITRIGSFVLNRACAALHVLHAHYPHLSCNVNLSVRQFVDMDLTNEIKTCLQKYELSPEALHLELTESMVAEHEKDILPTMQVLVDSGLKFHLDDFGTGYSSLERLRKLPIDTLKIDRSFVSPLSEGDDVMVRSIIRLGNELGMSIIAEGVETEAELNRLLELGCTHMQGYLFARPMPFTSLCDWLAEHKNPMS